jgi:transposase
MKMVEFTYEDLVAFSARLKIYLDNLKKEVITLESIIAEINNISSGKKNNSSRIFLPEEILKLRESKANEKSGIEWKKVVYEVVRKSDRFLNGKMIFNKIRVDRPFQISDERYALKCISSALVNLVSDGKVGKFKSGSGLYFFGDTERHFSDSGKPNFDFFFNEK